MEGRFPRTKDKRLLDPHVVIIGAGASIAACEYDKNGIRVPLLKNIHSVIGLTDQLLSLGFTEDEMQDFELLYSHIYGKAKYSKLQKELEFAISDYFGMLELPDTPTYYDYLILSLTSKDVIISFNWDPFLLQSYRRNKSVGNLPELVFPHGNVGAGICTNCKIKGYAGTLCSKCLNELSPMPLLFPIENKNYKDGSIFEGEWLLAENYLSQAAGLTVFGYGAPDTDTEAVELIKKAYLESRTKVYAPFEIINLPSVEQEQRQKWAQLYRSNMLLYSHSFKDSMLWRNPRVSLETLFDAILQQNPREDVEGFSCFSSLSDLQEYAKSISGFEMYFN